MKIAPQVLVLYMLIIIILTFIKSMFKKEYICIICESAATLLFAVNYLNCASILLSIACTELSLPKIKNTALTASLSLLLPAVIFKWDIPVYQILLTVIITISLSAIYKISIKTVSLEKETIELRKRINHLEHEIREEENSHNQTIYTARLEERTKISGNLHDKIGHTISAVLLQLEAIKFIMNSDKDRAYEMLTTSIETLRDGMDEIRIALRSIRPAEEEMGINRIKLLMEEKTKNTGFKFTINYTGDLNKITSSSWHMFAQCIMELSTNSIKYSKGSIITISINVLNKIIKLEVKDNGIGCTKIVKNIGLKNIEDKVLSENGKVIFHSDDGFSVIILMPY